jgi:metal-dependent HD superfamily phosphatase/phosphodiesterase
MLSATPSINVPAKEHEKITMLMEMINANEELIQLWRCANINAVDRSRMSDHGPVHVQIVANAAVLPSHRWRHHPKYCG